MRDINIKTYDKIAHKWAEGHFYDNKWNRQRISFLKLCKGNRLLDIACGPGRDTKYFIEKVYRVIGVDASSGMIKEARKRVPKGDFRKGDLLNIRFKDETFDGIWSCASILHVSKKKVDGVLEKFGKILKESGALFISVKRGKGEELKTYPDGSKRHFYYYSKQEMTRLVSKHFKIKRMYVSKDNDGDYWPNVFAVKK